MCHPCAVNPRVATRGAAVRVARPAWCRPRPVGPVAEPLRDLGRIGAGLGKDLPLDRATGTPVQLIGQPAGHGLLVIVDADPRGHGVTDHRDPQCLIAGCAGDAAPTGGIPWVASSGNSPPI